MEPFTLTAEEFQEYQDCHQGICSKCHALKDQCEPDAENYECPECGEHTVNGMEWALMKGLIDIIE